MATLAIGALVSGLQTAIANACGTRQHGAGRSGGATLEVAELRAAARLRPTLALVSLDVKNAFGSVEWPDALDAGMRQVPSLFVCTANHGKIHVVGVASGGVLHNGVSTIEKTAGEA